MEGFLHPFTAQQLLESDIKRGLITSVVEVDQMDLEFNNIKVNKI